MFNSVPPPLIEIHTKHKNADNLPSDCRGIECDVENFSHTASLYCITDTLSVLDGLLFVHVSSDLIPLQGS